VNVRMLWLCALLASAHARVLADAPASQVDDGPRGIRVLCDDGARFGAAVLLTDFRPDHEGSLLLLTALHVLHGCTKIEPVVVGCSSQTQALLPAAWSGERPVELLAWSALDLVAVVIPKADRAAFKTAIEPATLAASAKQVRPPYYSPLTVVAKSGINVCPRIPARRRDVVSVGDLYRSLAQPDYHALFGSLTASTVVMSYESTAVEGASGGPVLWLDEAKRAVVAVHLGGQATVVQWGVLVARDVLRDELDRLGSAALVRLDATHPTVAVENFAAPLQLSEPAPELNASLDVGLHRDGLFAQLEASTPVDPFGAVSNSLQLGWTHQWLSLPAVGFGAALGTRLSLGGTTGVYRSPVYSDNWDPNRDDEPLKAEKPQQGSARLPFFGGFAAADIELRFAQLSPLHYVVGLGVRAGATSVRHTGTHFTWGPVVYGRAQWRWSDRLSGLLQLHLTVVRIPADMTPLDCIGDRLRRETWDIWAGIGLGAELLP
jgi:hypothetical protein